jgi:hypothetical protein
MRDADLEKLLREMRAETFRPPEELLRRTRRRLFAPPLLRASLFVSLSLLTLGWLAVIIALLSPDLATEVKVAIASAGLAAWGSTLIGLIAARGALIPFLRLLDATASGKT